MTASFRSSLPLPHSSWSLIRVHTSPSNTNQMCGQVATCPHKPVFPSYAVPCPLEPQMPLPASNCRSLFRLAKSPVLPPPAMIPALQAQYSSALCLFLSAYLSSPENARISNYSPFPIRKPPHPLLSKEGTRGWCP